MSYDPHKHDRKSIRIHGYDYAQPGEYFVTICTKDRECIFGEIVNGKMVLNDIGKIAEIIWKEIPKHFNHTGLDEFIVMPNHVHGIINIIHDVGATESVALSGNHNIIIGETNSVAHNIRATGSVAPTRPNGPMPNSIGAIIGQYKSVATKQINKIRQTFGLSVWQRN